MYALEKYIAECGLEPKLVHLLKMRASQINGCAYCIDMHSKDPRALGESEQRLYKLDAWRETPFYSDRERAALAWVEAVTLVWVFYDGGGGGIRTPETLSSLTVFKTGDCALSHW